MGEKLKVDITNYHIFFRNSGTLCPSIVGVSLFDYRGYYSHYLTFDPEHKYFNIDKEKIKEKLAHRSKGSFVDIIVNEECELEEDEKQAFLNNFEGDIEGTRIIGFKLNTIWYTNVFHNSQYYTYDGTINGLIRKNLIDVRDCFAKHGTIEQSHYIELFYTREFFKLLEEVYNEK